MNSNVLRLTFVTTEISQEIKLKEEAWALGWAGLGLSIPSHFNVTVPIHWRNIKNI
jgi:hypothetical protein